VSNPLSVIEQITYLLFIKRLDELQTVEERKAATLQIPIERRIFPEGKAEKGRPYADLRWARFKSFEPREMFTVVDEHVFPFLRTLGGEGSAFSQHMKDARLGIPTTVEPVGDRCTVAPASICSAIAYCLPPDPRKVWESHSVDTTGEFVGMLRTGCRSGCRGGIILC
jgi:type I restriction enzyme M protein